MAITVMGARLASPGWGEDGRSDPPILIELKAKRWKGLQIVAFVLGLLGFLLLGWQIWAEVYEPLLTAGLTLKTQPVPMLGDALFGFGGIFGLLALLAALGIGVYARFMAWWRHG